MSVPSTPPFDEERMMEMLRSIFESFNMDLPIDDIKALLGQFEKQLEGLGIDLTKISEGKLNVNLQTSFEDIMRLMGNQQASPNLFQKQAEIEIKVDKEGIRKIPIDDLYIMGEKATASIDCSTHISEHDCLEVALLDDGRTLRILGQASTHPLETLHLPVNTKSITGWSINNSVMEVDLIIDESTDRNDGDGGIPII